MRRELLFFATTQNFERETEFCHRNLSLGTSFILYFDNNHYSTDGQYRNGIFYLALLTSTNTRYWKKESKNERKNSIGSSRLSELNKASNFTQWPPESRVRICACMFFSRNRKRSTPLRYYDFYLHWYTCNLFLSFVFEGKELKL